MRQSVAAFALFWQFADDRQLWLAQWNRRWNAYNFVGGHKRADETFRDCAIREIGEELGLTPDAEFTVGAEPLAHHEYTAFSRSNGQETHYVIEVFTAELGGPQAWEKVQSCPENRWLSREEIRTGLGKDGRCVSETMKSMLDRLGWPK